MGVLILRQLRCISEHKLATILLVGLLIRVILMPISAHPFDVYAWYLITTDISENGPFNLQNFPPLWGHYLLVPISYVYSWLANIFSTGAISMSSLSAALDFYPAYNIQFVPGLLFNFVVKFPFLISDIAVTLLLYKIVSELTENNVLAEKAALFWFLNPFLIWISAGWGMWDTLPVLFSLAAFYFLLHQKLGFSGVFLSLGVAAKLYPVLFLLPITFYLFKIISKCNRWKKLALFYLIFIVTSSFLFFPYFGTIANFFNSYFMPSSLNGINVGFDPVVEPVGFGLTYWSISLLNRLDIVSLTVSSVFFASIVSFILFGIFLTVIYWKVSKLSFQRPAFDLMLAMLFSIIALFLSYRIICEQFFVWLLPFLIILCVSGNIKTLLYWGASFVALLYSVLNCPLPYFFLPLAPLAENSLLSIVAVFWFIDPLRIISLVILGCIFSVLMLIVLVKLFRP